MATRDESIKPNVACWILGAVTMAIGVLVAAVGARDTAAIRGPDQFSGDGPRAVADSVSGVVWGVMIVTIGLYLWRGARRRGWRDRFGRVLIIAGYVLLGLALTKSVHIGVGIWSTLTEKETTAVMNTLMITFLVWGVPASALIFVGARLANERIITTASMTVNR